jgi:hypothetical protein
MIYDEYRLVAHDATYYDYSVDEHLPLDFAEICQVSLAEGMKPLSANDIQKHLFGIAVLGSYSAPHRFEHTEVVAYAGITAFEHYMGSKLAIIGGIITLPRVRKQGQGISMVAKLCEISGSEEAVGVHGHQGFLARCNDDSKKLTKKLGFSEKGKQLGKTLMVKML